MSGFKGILVNIFKAKDGGTIGSESVIEYTTPAPVYADLPVNGLITKSMLMGTGVTTSIQVPFTTAGVTVLDWQAGIPAGYTQTYAQLLGNIIPHLPSVWFFTSGTNYINNGAGDAATVEYDGTLVISMTIDLQGQTGYIRF